MSSLALRRGLDAEVELWLAGLFTAAELAAADLLLQLRVAGAGGGDEAAESSSDTTLSSRRSASPCLEELASAEEQQVRRSSSPCLEDLTAEEEQQVRRSSSPCLEVLTAAEEEQEVEERAVAEPALSTELDRRATKRYRLLSDLYAATAPVTSASTSAAAAKKKKRKRRHLQEGWSSSEPFAEEAPRYGGDY
ncbi:unnamed protein product [Alopecurus aequalis]